MASKFMNVVKQSHDQYGTKLKKLFDHYDKNKDGVLDQDEFKALVSQMCNTHGEIFPSESAINEILLAADKNWDGVLDYQEFVSFLKDFPLLLEMYRDD